MKMFHQRLLIKEGINVVKENNKGKVSQKKKKINKKQHRLSEEMKVIKNQL